MGTLKSVPDLAMTLAISALQVLGLWMRRVICWLRSLRLRPQTQRSRADVPGWVLITLMSAILVAGLLAIAGPALEKMFTDAMNQVKPGT